MPTPNFNLPLIDGASPISIVSDMNSLATAADSAMAKLATQGDISAIKTQVTNANKVATEAQAEAVKASGSADAASKSAATANATANTAKGSADNANASVVALKTKTDSIESHVYFQDMERNSANPFPVQGWNAKRSNDFTRFEINGYIGIKPGGGGDYVDNETVRAAKITVPGTTSIYGIPLFNLGKAPTSALRIISGVFFHTANASDPYSYNNVYTAEIYVGTDGVAYLATKDALDKATGITYGTCNSGTWSF